MTVKKRNKTLFWAIFAPIIAGLAIYIITEIISGIKSHELKQNNDINLKANIIDVEKIRVQLATDIDKKADKEIVSEIRDLLKTLDDRVYDLQTRNKITSKINFKKDTLILIKFNNIPSKTSILFRDTNRIKMLQNFIKDTLFCQKNEGFNLFRFLGFGKR